jgi:acetyl-CoA carboxylase carboxyltransferase component
VSEKTSEELLAQLEAQERALSEPGGRARVERHHKLGRLLGRERLERFLDAKSFVEWGRHIGSAQTPGDGLVCGMGTVEGKPVAVYAHEPTVARGALSSAASRKLCRLLDLAYDRRLPVISFADSDGVRVDEGIDAVTAYGDVIARTVRLKSRVPQLTLVSGLCVGAAAYNAALTDLVAMVDGQSFMFITGPKVTQAVTGEEADIQSLGGPRLHAKKTGACHALVASEDEGISFLRRTLELFSTSLSPPQAPRADSKDISELVPASSRRAYDMRKVLDALVDEGSALELSSQYAPNLLTVFARIEGRAVAIVASQPMVLAGCLDIDASRKGAAFVTLATQRRLPLLTLVDVPGYLPGQKQEEGGIIPHGAALLAAYGSADIPKLCLIVRKSFGGASVLSYAADFRLALPTARIAPMGAEAAVDVTLGAVSASPTPDELREREALNAQYEARFETVWPAAESGYIDRVIRPQNTRREIALCLARLCGGSSPR